MAVLPWLLVAALASPALTARAQSGDRAHGRGHLVAELDPVDVASRGATVFLGWTPRRDARLTVGASLGTQAIDGRARDLLFRGADDLDMRLTWVAGAEARYRVTGGPRVRLRAGARTPDIARNGFWLGVSAGGEEFRARTRPSPTRPAPASETRFNAFVMPGIGYAWYPRGGRLLVNPQVGGIFVFATNRSRRVGDVAYELRPFFPAPTVRVGWVF